MPTGLAVHRKQGKHHLTLIPGFTNPVRFFPYTPLIDSLLFPLHFHSNDLIFATTLF